MDDKTIAIYCLCDDLLQAMHHEEDPQRFMTDAEILTTAFVATLFFRGNMESARALLKKPCHPPALACHPTPAMREPNAIELSGGEERSSLPSARTSC